MEPREQDGGADSSLTSQVPEVEVAQRGQAKVGSSCRFTVPDLEEKSVTGRTGCRGLSARLSSAAYDFHSRSVLHPLCVPFLSNF
jgi:hypothetical protein